MVDYNRLHSGEAKAMKEDDQSIIAYLRVVVMLENFIEAEDRLDVLFASVFQIVKVSKEFKKFRSIIFTVFSWKF